MGRELQNVEDELEAAEVAEPDVAPVGELMDGGAMDEIGVANEACPICLEPFAGSRAAYPLKRCGHVVCAECWPQWAEARASRGRAAFCPLCRCEDFCRAIHRYA